MTVESGKQSAIVKDLVSRGRSKEYSTAGLLKNVRFAFAPNSSSVIRITDTSVISPHLKVHQLLAAVARLGGYVTSISMTDAISRFGPSELDIGVIKQNNPPIMKNSITDIQGFGNARLIGSPESNILLLTSEQSGIVTVRSGLRNSEIRAAREWLIGAELTELSESVVSQFQLRSHAGTGMGTALSDFAQSTTHGNTGSPIIETIAFIPLSQPVTLP